jgi:hypothetical protein
MSLDFFILKHKDLQMKFTKTLIAAALFATVGTAQASFTTPATTSSGANGADLVLTVVDTTDGNFYALDLGITTAQLIANPSVLGTVNITDSNFASFVNAETAGANILYKVEGGSQSKNAYVTTLDTTVATADFGAQVKPILSGAFSNVTTEFGAYAGYAAGASSIFEVGSAGGYTQAASINDSGSLGNYSSSAAPGTALNLLLEQRTSSTVWTPTQLGTYDLTVNGTTATLAPPAAVPLPATAWMFISGMLGLLSFGRNKKSA